MTSSTRRLRRAYFAFFLAWGASTWASGAAFKNRFNHSSTLLPSGDVLVVGGQDAGGRLSALTTAQIILERTGVVSNVASLAVARTSHTATLLPNGEVLVAGGVNGVGAVATAEVYNPVGNCWHATVAMSAARYSHTATLLKNGKVLVCGGHSDTNTGTNSSCELFTPAAADPTCAASPGTFALTGSLSVPRAAHTATLQKDGKVFIAGGFDPSGGSATPFLVTTERYDPSLGSFSSTHALNEARGFHAATLLNDGKVLLSGGFNGSERGGDKGYLETVERYDPASNSMLTVASMAERRLGHTSTLDNDGTVKIYGGLGNITTTYFNPGGTLLDNGAFITGSFAPSNVMSTMNITGGTLGLQVDTVLSVNASGVIEKGEILFSTPSVAFTDGIAYFRAGTDQATVGLRADLAGTQVYCKTGGGCGNITKDFSLTNIQGQYFITPITVSFSNQFISAGSLAFAGGPLSQFNSPLTLNGDGTLGTAGGGNVTATTIALPAEFIGANISSGTVVLTAGNLVEDSSFTVTITGARGAVAANTPVVSDGNGGALATFLINWTSVSGTVAWASADPARTFNSPLVIPMSPAVHATFSGMSGKLTFVVDRVDLSNKAFNVDIATIVIERMMFGDQEIYTPSSNQWSINPRRGGSEYNQTATLMPNGDLRLIGGQTCNFSTSDCSGPHSPRSWQSYVSTLLDWTGAGASLSTARANHSSTLLPDGTILVAGGTDNQGLTALASAELFDPNSRSFSQVGSLNVSRDLHTATLLPNGRVLAAGGFTTTGSTGSTATAEIYYPDSKTWVPTQSMGSVRDDHAAVVMADGNVLVAGGQVVPSGTYLSSAEIYYSTSAVWRPIQSMPRSRALHTLTLLHDGRILASGGVNQTGVLAKNDIYDPATGLWTAAADFNNGVGQAISVHSHRATALLDGRVLVTGGNNGNGETTTSLIYDPVADRWTDTRASGNGMNVARFNHTATLLPNGIVLVTGGAQALGNSLDVVETFDVALSSWQIPGKLTTPRAYHSVVVARDGYVYAIGGANNGSYLSSADKIYFTGFPDTAGLPTGNPTLRQSTITAVDLPIFDRGQSVSLIGGNFQGVSEASGGGAGSANSSHFQPRLLLQALDAGGASGAQGASGFAVDLTTRIYANTANVWTQTDSSITVQMPALGAEKLSIPYGWYELRTNNNGQFANGFVVQAGPKKPTGSPSNLAATAIYTTSVTWTWTPAAGSFDGYDVYNASNSVFIGTAPSASYTELSLAPNTTAQIKVAAYTLTGDGPAATSPLVYSLAVAPAALAVTSTTSSGVLLSWSDNGNSPGTIYEVSQSSDGFVANFSTPVPTDLSLTSLSASIGFLLPSTTYYFRVRAFNGSGVPSGFSNVVSTQTRAPVLGLSGSALDTSDIQWSWTDPGGVSYYKVYAATTGAVIATTTASSFLDAHLGTNTARGLQVSAVTPSGEGPLSASATVYTFAAIPSAVPNALVGLTTAGFTGQWGAGGNPSGTAYTMTVSTGGTVHSTVNTTALSATVSDLAPPATLWTAKVSASNGDGIATTPLTLGSTATLASPPSGLTVLGTTPSSIAVSWSANGNSSLATYEVLYSTDNFITNVSTALDFSRNSNQTSLVIGSLLTSQTYEIKVGAQNSAGIFGGFSNVVSTQTFNGGVAAGSLGGTVSFNQDTTISGTLGDGRFVSLRVPARTFSSDLFVTVSSFTVPPSPCAAGADIGVSILTAPPMQPSIPLFLTVSYSDAELAAVPIDPALAAMMRVDDATGRCVPLKTTLDSANHLATAQLNHLSNFQLAQVSPSATPETAVVFPNPFYPSRGNGYVTFSQLPADARVRLFTLRGELVVDGTANASGLFTWAGTNSGGRPVASGVYLAAIESQGAKKVLKVAVLR